jgi:hypothetical protein
MNAYRVIVLVTIVSGLLAAAGCANVPLTEGGLLVAKDTTCGIEDVGVARVTRGF